MGRSRFLHPGLIVACACALLAGCGVDEDELLVAASNKDIYSGAGGAGKYAIADAGGAPGTITGTVTYAGRKRARPIDMAGRPFCSNRHPDGLLAEDFQVGPGQELGGVVVYIKKGIPSWGETPSEPAVLDQIKCQYVPHIVFVRTGQPLLIKSSDDTLHNVKSGKTKNQSFNDAMTGVGQLAPKTFKKSEMKKLLCNAHAWMIAYVAIMPHPFHALTGDTGTFKITGIPPGTYQLEFWHEKLGTQVMDVTIGAGETKTQDALFEDN